MLSHSMSREAGKLNHPRYFLVSMNGLSRLKYNACTHWKLILVTVLSLILVSFGIDALLMWHQIHIITPNLVLWYNKGLIHWYYVIPKAIAGMCIFLEKYALSKLMCSCLSTRRHELYIANLLGSWRHTWRVWFGWSSWPHLVQVNTECLIVYMSSMSVMEQSLIVTYVIL